MMLFGPFVRNLGAFSLSLWCLLKNVGYRGAHAASPIAYNFFVKSATYSIANQFGYFVDENLDENLNVTPPSPPFKACAANPSWSAQNSAATR